jgi:putative ABC transport system ATP-binding protein
VASAAAAAASAAAAEAGRSPEVVSGEPSQLLAWRTGPDYPPTPGSLNGPVHQNSVRSPVRPLVQFVRIWKTYTAGSVPVHALQGVSISVYPGEYISIVGPSGSGKSTFMHILGCLDVPTSGHYYLAGTDVSKMDEEALAEVRNRRIGFVFQQFHLLPRLSAWRNVELPLIYAGVDRRTRKLRALEALEQVGLADRVTHHPNQLSGGQQQRVAVARALVTEPDLLLADEPTGNLDSRSSADVLGMLDALHKTGRTIVLITHEQDVAEAAERIMRFRDGRFLDAEGNAA